MAQAGTAETLKVGVVGGTGYTGVVLLCPLLEHPSVCLQAVIPRSEKGLDERAGINQPVLLP